MDLGRLSDGNERPDRHNGKQVLLKRLQVTVHGAVQGVGFRPFVYRLAVELGLRGWVNNSAQGALIEVEGQRSQLEDFVLRLRREKPPRSLIQSLHLTWLTPLGERSFEIRPSTTGEKTALIPPDIAACSECLQEIFDPSDRRYRYPFANCTNCGPRFSLIEGLPYDRPQTTMKRFQLCARCRAEYANPLDRRFHAQPNACPHCGPQLALWSRAGKELASGDEALLMAAQGIRQGKIVAIKGLAGFHLGVDARNCQAVNRLRERKRRPEKPFALMYPFLELVEAHCHVSSLEARLLRSPQAPIVLLRRITLGDLCAAVAPGNPNSGIMLPYTPLHHLLMAELGFPIVATSGNLANEPICTDEQEALSRLGGIAELFLVHNRPIARPVDDSIVQVTMGREMVLRRARGYAPLPIPWHRTRHAPKTILAVGAHRKNAIALAVDQQVFISQHIGDLETVPAFETFQKTIQDFQRLYTTPSVIATDAHSGYLSTQFAQQLGFTVAVQHHYAHVLSCMADNGLIGSNVPILGIAWDGTGYGLDNTIWGGEFLNITDTSFERVAHLRPFPLPGGDKAIKDPRRLAIGLLYTLYGDSLFELQFPPLPAFSDRELKGIKTMLQRNINSPLASSAGRLFDAVAAMIGLCEQTSYEGQAAMALEFAIATLQTEQRYEFALLQPQTKSSAPIIIDWVRTIQQVLSDIERSLSPNAIAAKFHNTLVEMIVATAKAVGREHIVLSGGCFQNQYLLERTIERLQEENFHPYWHRHIPCHDGGIAVGQIMAVVRTDENREG